MNISPTSLPTPTPQALASPAPGSTAAQPTGDTGAGSLFQNAIDGVSSSLADADSMAQQVATGEITDLSQLTAATAKAELAIQLTVAFRDRAVDSFTQIMQMQV